jgi:hypothetical protein
LLFLPNLFFVPRASVSVPENKLFGRRGSCEAYNSPLTRPAGLCPLHAGLCKASLRKNDTDESKEIDKSAS